MTLSEFSREFDILYNNILSGAAPGINEYEKSVLLTNALESIVKEYYTGNIQKLIPSFEGTERVRKELGELVRTHTATYDAVLNGALATIKIHDNSVFFEIPTDVWFTVFEQANTYPDPCTDAPQKVKIRPIRHDYFNVLIDNPFRKPNKEWAWRLDLESQDNKRIIELVYLYLPVETYYFRYVHKPAPIVLTDFETHPDLSGLSLSVRGVNTESDNELPSLSREILELAVANAVMRYRENSLQNITNFK